MILHMKNQGINVDDLTGRSFKYHFTVKAPALTLSLHAFWQMKYARIGR